MAIKTIETFDCSRCEKKDCEREIDPSAPQEHLALPDLEIIAYDNGEGESEKNNQLHRICDTCRPIVDNAIARILEPQKRPRNQAATDKKD